MKTNVFIIKLELCGVSIIVALYLFMAFANNRVKYCTQKYFSRVYFGGAAWFGIMGRLNCISALRFEDICLRYSGLFRADHPFNYSLISRHPLNLLFGGRFVSPTCD